MIRRGGLALLVVLALGGCLTPTGTQKPAEVIAYGQRGGAGSTGMHTVLGGDTVYTVAKHYNLPLRDIIAVNDLSPPYTLPAGYRLKLPAPNEYKVRAADTLNRISRLFDASPSEIARLNSLSAPYVLNKGQVLRLPSAQPDLQKEMAGPDQSPRDGDEIEVVALPPRVEAVEIETLPPPPGMGQTSAVTPAGLPPAVSPAPPQAVSTTTPSTAGFPPQPVPQNAPAVQTASAAQAAPSGVAPKVPARAGSRFMRPVDGKILSGYGPKEGGLHNDGINIKAPRGTSVRAAENGVVVYVGSELSGYGNLVLIRHADRWMTAYAHMDKMLVRKNDVVRAGQVIGTVGATGQVASPQLHFEIRKGTQAVDPQKYL